MAALPRSLSFIPGTAKSRAGNTLRTDNPQSHNYFPPLSTVPLQPESSVIKALDFRVWEAAALVKGTGQRCSEAGMLGGQDARGSGCSEAGMLGGSGMLRGRNARRQGCSRAGTLGRDGPRSPTSQLLHAGTKLEGARRGPAPQRDRSPGISRKPSAVREPSLHITFCHLQQVNRRLGTTQWLGNARRLRQDISEQK